MAAPTYVASGTPGESASPSVAVAAGVPAGHAVNDIFILTVGANRTSSLTTPTGWTQLSSSPQTNTADATNNTDNKLYVYWRRSTSTTHTSANLNVDAINAGLYTIVRMHAFRVCPTTVDPIHVTVGSTTNSSVDPGVCADITTT